MNRLSSLITAGLTTGLSAAALGATAMAQGVFGGGDPAPADTAAVQQVAEPTWTATTTAVTAATQENPTPQVVYVDKEPIVVTRQVQVPAASSPASQSGTEGASAGGGDSTATATTTPSTPVPSPATVPAQAMPSSPEPGPFAPPPPVDPGAALLGTGGVSTAGATDDRGGDTPRDDRVEPGDDRQSHDGDDRDDDHDDDDREDDDD